MAEKMTSTRPYLLRAFHEWIVDNDLTPYIVIDAESPTVNVPRQYVEEGKIVLNISPLATESLIMTNHRIEFEASFGGVVEKISAPIRTVLAIYTRENGRGMIFSEEEPEDEPPPTDEPGDEGGVGTAGKPKLRVVK